MNSGIVAQYHQNVIAPPPRLLYSTSCSHPLLKRTPLNVLSAAFEKSDYEHIAQLAARKAINARSEYIMDHF